MTFTVHLFARARELAEADSVALELPEGSAVSNLRAALVECVPALTAILGVSIIAVNHEFAADVQTLAAGDEVAMIPPVSGG